MLDLNSVNDIELLPGVLNIINSLGIGLCQKPTSRKTHRGVRAGRRKQQNAVTPVNKKPTLKFCSLNARSLRNKCNEFVEFVQANDLDLIAITETWFKPDDISVVRACTPSGFSFHHIPRSVRTGGGVGLLYRSTLSINVTDIHFDYSTFESLHCELTCNSLSVRLVVIYRPIKTISGQHVNFTNFLGEFENLINDYLLHPSELILTGDFNIHVDDESNSNCPQIY